MITIRSICVLACLVLAACFESHGATDLQLASSDCYTCHKANYDVAGAPPSAGFPLAPNHTDPAKKCSTQCAQCHTTTDWSNFMGGCQHPETDFPLSTQGTRHTNLQCSACHNEAISIATGVTALHGANTDCIACHPNTTAQRQAHVGVVYESGALAGRAYAYSDTDHRFCLDCHPKGLAIGHGPSNPFILPHHGSTCAQCHDTASGLGHQNGADVRCTVGCHDGTNGDRAHHFDTNHHPGCLAAGCHPDGRSHGD